MCFALRQFAKHCRTIVALYEMNLKKERILTSISYRYLGIFYDVNFSANLSSVNFRQPN